MNEFLTQGAGATPHSPAARSKEWGLAALPLNKRSIRIQNVAVLACQGGCTHNKAAPGGAARSSAPLPACARQPHTGRYKRFTECSIQAQTAVTSQVLSSSQLVVAVPASQAQRAHRLRLATATTLHSETLPSRHQTANKTASPTSGAVCCPGYLSNHMNGNVLSFSSW